MPTKYYALGVFRLPLVSGVPRPVLAIREKVRTFVAVKTCFL